MTLQGQGAKPVPCSPRERPARSSSDAVKKTSPYFRFNGAWGFGSARRPASRGLMRATFQGQPPVRPCSDWRRAQWLYGRRCGTSLPQGHLVCHPIKSRGRGLGIARVEGLRAVSRGLQWPRPTACLPASSR